MKVFFLIISLPLILAACSNNSSVEDKPDEIAEKVTYQMNEEKLSAVAANNLISNIQRAALEMVDEVFQSDSAALPNNVQNAIFELEVSIQRVEEMTGLKKLGTFKKAVINLFKFYQNAFENDFQSLIPTIQNSNPTASEKAILQKYDEDFRRKEMVFFKEISQDQEAFAAANKINLVD